MIIRDILRVCTEKYAALPAVRWLEKKNIRDRSYGELMAQIAVVRSQLLAEDFAGKHIALIGTSSVEWITAYLGIVTGGMVAVPLDAVLPGEELIDLIQRSDSEGLFLSPRHMALLDAIQAACPKLRRIWILQESTENMAQNHAPVVSSIGELIQSVAAQDKASGKQATEPDVSPDALATIIFTSGTTGKSKGVMLSQSNLAENVNAVNYYAEPGTVLLSVLPIHHAFCLVMDWLKGFSLGSTVCINDSLLHMMRNMSIFKPEIMLMVPLMVETMNKRLASADPAIPKSVLAKKVFGGNLRILFIGGAHLDPFYIDQFAAYGVDVFEGYGMSECSPVISANMPQAHKAGSIGRPLNNVEIAFDDGEILVRGSSVMQGYYQMPDETAQTLQNGWLHTGDKGYLDDEGYLYINGRVKNLIILSNGENISPEELENKLALHPLIGEVIITGENNGLTARIYPDQDVIAAKNLTAEDVQSGIQSFIAQFNQSQPTYRQITALVIRQYPFRKTAAKKIKRTEVTIDEPPIN